LSYSNDLIKCFLLGLKNIRVESDSKLAHIMSGERLGNNCLLSYSKRSHRQLELDMPQLCTSTKHKMLLLISWPKVQFLEDAP